MTRATASVIARASASAPLYPCKFFTPFPAGDRAGGSRTHRQQMNFTFLAISGGQRRQISRIHAGCRVVGLGRPSSGAPQIAA